MPSYYYYAASQYYVVDAAYCYRCSVICRSLCGSVTIVTPETAEPIETGNSESLARGGGSW